MKLYRFLTFSVLQNKRLLSAWSFILVLLVIPLFAFGMKFFFKQESGVYKVTLCAEESNDEAAKKIIERLKSSNSVLHFSVSADKEAAEESVKSGKSDAAWIFMPELESRIREYCSNSGAGQPFVKILQRDESVTANLSHEKLYGAVFPEVTYFTFENYVNENFAELNLSREEIKTLYNTAEKNNHFIEYKYLESGQAFADSDYLSSAVRGLLAVVTVVCGLAAQTVFLTDKKRGAYDWMKESRHIFAGMGITFAAVFDGALITFVSMLCTGNSVSLGKELMAAVCLIAVSFPFCVLAGTLIGSPKTLGICIPFITLVLLLISPIFFNLYKIRQLQILFPPYYYLNTFYGAKYFVSGLVYAVAVLAAAWIFDAVKRRIKSKIV